jgi:hypothetical protein
MSDSSTLQLSELRETQGLVEVMRLVIENYTRVTTGSGDHEAAMRAARRVELALLECNQKAAGELAVEPKAGSFNCISCGSHDLDRDLNEFREKGEVSAVLLMRKFRYRFDHAARAIQELQDRGFVELVGPTLALATASPSGGGLVANEAVAATP